MENSNNDPSKEGFFSALMFAVIYIAFMIMLSMMFSCNTAAQTPEEEKIYINVDGLNVELVADEYGGQYLKQFTGTGGFHVYIPYLGATEETDTLRFYNTKN